MNKITSARSIHSLYKLPFAQFLLVLLFACDGLHAQCGSDQTSYGDQQWIGYHYMSAATNYFATYKGSTTEPATFNNNYPELFWGLVPHFNVCSTNFYDNFAIRYKMQRTFNAGCYTFTVGGDDGYRLSLDGGSTWVIENWDAHEYETTTYSVYLSAGTQNLVLEYFEEDGNSRVSFNYGYTSASTAPSSVAGVTSVCAPSGNITLTASGGTHRSGAVYQWGTGNTAGSAIIAGQTNSTITVNPGTATTTYWVRRVDAAPCSQPTAARFHTITVAARSTAPSSILGVSSICSGASTTLTATGGTHGTNALYQWGTGSVGANIITGATGSTVTVSPVANTVYWVRRVDSAPCSVTTTAATSTVTVLTRSTPPTSLTGAPALSCSGAAVTLTATGGTSAPGATFQWGTGTTVGANTIAGTGSSIVVNPTATTTYWVRRYDASCGYYTVHATATINIVPATVAGTLSTATNIICSGTTPSNITLNGNVGTIVKWQKSNNSSFTASVADIASTASILTGSAIGPLTGSTYFRAVVQNAGCTVAYTAPIQIIIPATVTYNGSWSSTPSMATRVIINSDYTLTSDLEVCSCKISGTAKLTIAPNATLLVEKNLEVMPNANIIVENNGSIVQMDDAAVNSGSITFKRQTTPMREMDFTYWSSPVQNMTLYNLSPATRYDKYFSFNPTSNNWTTHLNGTAAMNAGKGYIVRAPQGWSLTNPTSGKYTASFNGIPNNGVISATITKGAGTFNLIGNPYPSAIDIDLFLTDPANEDIINGTIYLWSHNTAISSTIPGNSSYNYTADDYAKYNLTGGVKTAASAITGGVAPSGKIAAGQAFFIEANTALPNGNYSVNFKNNMRVTGENSQFFRHSARTAAEKHRLWLSVSNSQGAYDEMLLGYVEGATNAFDSKYDGAIFPAGNVVALYSMLDNDALAIQGRALPFNSADIIPLGFTTTLSGTMTVSIENFDGIFADQNVYLLDHNDGSMHNLKNSAYAFTTSAGTFNNRFELRFDGQSLAIDNPVTDSDVVVFAKDGKINVDGGTIQLSAIAIHDLTGKLLYDNAAIDENRFSIDFNLAPQVLIIRVTTDSGSIVTKKVVIQ